MCSHKVCENECFQECTTHVYKLKKNQPQSVFIISSADPSYAHTGHYLKERKLQ